MRCRYQRMVDGLSLAVSSRRWSVVDTRPIIQTMRLSLARIFDIFSLVIVFSIGSDLDNRALLLLTVFTSKSYGCERKRLGNDCDARWQRNVECRRFALELQPTVGKFDTLTLMTNLYATEKIFLMSKALQPYQ